MSETNQPLEAKKNRSNLMMLLALLPILPSMLIHFYDLGIYTIDKMGPDTVTQEVVEVSNIDIFSEQHKWYRDQTAGKKITFKFEDKKYDKFYPDTSPEVNGFRFHQKLEARVGVCKITGDICQLDLVSPDIKKEN